MLNKALFLGGGGIGGVPLDSHDTNWDDPPSGPLPIHPFHVKARCPPLPLKELFIVRMPTHRGTLHRFFFCPQERMDLGLSKNRGGVYPPKMDGENHGTPNPIKNGSKPSQIIPFVHRVWNHYSIFTIHFGKVNILPIFGGNGFHPISIRWDCLCLGEAARKIHGSNIYQLNSEKKTARNGRE